MDTVNLLKKKGLKENPEIALVLEIAERAREANELDVPQDFYVSSDVTAIPARLKQGAAEEFITACLV